MTVTRLKATGRNAARTRVELDGEVWAEIDTEVVLKWQLVRGQELDTDEQTRLLEDDACVRARRAAARLLHARPRARRELEQRLLQKEFAPSVVERTLDYFEEKGDLNDAAFARRYAAHMLKTRSTIGPRKLALKLRQLGVADRHIDDALAESAIASDEEQRRRCEILARKKLASMRRLDPLKRRRRLQGALARAGFSPEVYSTVLRDMLE
ncbi:MAG: regulatory protein RecX [Candidatus Sumerlaeota bacterium]